MRRFFTAPIIFVMIVALSGAAFAKFSVKQGTIGKPFQESEKWIFNKKNPNSIYDKMPVCRTYQVGELPPANPPTVLTAAMCAKYEKALAPPPYGPIVTTLVAEGVDGSTQSSGSDNKINYVFKSPPGAETPAGVANIVMAYSNDFVDYWGMQNIVLIPKGPDGNIADFASLPVAGVAAGSGLVGSTSDVNGTTQVNVEEGRKHNFFSPIFESVRDVVQSGDFNMMVMSLDVENKPRYLVKKLEQSQWKRICSGGKVCADNEQHLYIQKQELAPDGMSAEAATKAGYLPMDFVAAKVSSSPFYPRNKPDWENFTSGAIADSPAVDQNLPKDQIDAGNPWSITNICGRDRQEYLDGVSTWENYDGYLKGLFQNLFDKEKINSEKGDFNHYRPTQRDGVLVEGAEAIRGLILADKERQKKYVKTSNEVYAVCLPQCYAYVKSYVLPPNVSCPQLCSDIAQYVSCRDSILKGVESPNILPMVAGGYEDKNPKGKIDSIKNNLKKALDPRELAKQAKEKLKLQVSEFTKSIASMVKNPITMQSVNLNQFSGSINKVLGKNLSSPINPQSFGDASNLANKLAPAIEKTFPNQSDKMVAFMGKLRGKVSDNAMLAQLKKLEEKVANIKVPSLNVPNIQMPQMPQMSMSVPNIFTEKTMPKAWGDILNGGIVPQGLFSGFQGLQGLVGKAQGLAGKAQGLVGKAQGAVGQVQGVAQGAMQGAVGQVAGKAKQGATNIAAKLFPKQLAQAGDITNHFFDSGPKNKFNIHAPWPINLAQGNVAAGGLKGVPKEPWRNAISYLNPALREDSEGVKNQKMNSIKDINSGDVKMAAGLNPKDESWNKFLVLQMLNTKKTGVFAQLDPKQTYHETSVNYAVNRVFGGELAIGERVLNVPTKLPTSGGANNGGAQNAVYADPQNNQANFASIQGALLADQGIPGGPGRRMADGSIWPGKDAKKGLGSYRYGLALAVYDGTDGVSNLLNSKSTQKPYVFVVEGRSSDGCLTVSYIPDFGPYGSGELVSDPVQRRICEKPGVLPYKINGSDRMQPCSVVWAPVCYEENFRDIRWIMNDKPVDRDKKTGEIKGLT